MADNINVTPGTGSTIAADDIGGVLHQRVKISQGADGAATDVSSASPLNVTLANTGANATPIVVDLGANNDVTVTGTVTANLAAGTNNIGDVDVLTINGVAPAFGSGVRGATVQRVTVATDDVVPASQSGTWNITNVSGTVSLPTGAATAANQSTEITSLQLLDDTIVADNAAFTDGTTKLDMAGYIYDEVAGTALTENDAAAARINVNRAQIAAIEDGVTRGRYATVSASNALKVDGSAVTQPVSIATNTPVGNVAHDAADSGAPIKTGGRARTTEITAVASDDRVDSIHDKVGKQIVLPYSIPESFVSGAITTAMTGTTSTSLVAAPGAGLRNYLTTIIVSNSHATVGTDVIIQDGSGGTTLMTIPAAAVYGGAVITLPTPLRQPTTATAIFCANVTTGASTKVSAVGYTGA